MLPVESGDAMKKEWFVLHTLTGQEGKVQESIRRRIKAAPWRGQ